MNQHSAKPLIFDFIEEASFSEDSPNEIIYCKTSNLSVIKGTDIPAIDLPMLSTFTFTKATGEGTDPDISSLNNTAHCLDTFTNTRLQREDSDSDNSLKQVEISLVTKLITEAREGVKTD